jgi:antitoxin component YwqK of YwqJK toxin-antitoxin module
MKILLLSLALFCSITLPAQYYYNDIIGTQETNRQMRSYRDNKVRTVSAAGYDQRGTKATDFSEFRELKENGNALRLSSIVNFNKTIIYSKFDANGRVISMTDSSAGIVSTTSYEYDAQGRLSRVQNSTKDSANDFTQVEIHSWRYDNAGRPQTMWRTLNNADSLEIRFIPDEKGNPGEEVTYRKGKETDRLYYYFDEQNRITDIVRYNEKIKKLMPDNIITYDDAGRVIQIITSTPGDKYGRITWVGFQTWRYVYDEKGLKTAEALFNNEQEMTGRIKYSYTFGQ